MNYCYLNFLIFYSNYLKYWTVINISLIFWDISNFTTNIYHFWNLPFKSYFWHKNSLTLITETANLNTSWCSHLLYSHPNLADHSWQMGLRIKSLMVEKPIKVYHLVMCVIISPPFFHHLIVLIKQWLLRATQTYHWYQGDGKPCSMHSTRGTTVSRSLASE